MTPEEWRELPVGTLLVNTSSWKPERVMVKHEKTGNYGNLDFMKVNDTPEYDMTGLEDCGICCSRHTRMEKAPSWIVELIYEGQEEWNNTKQ